jgi:hypothetical protein
MHMAMLSWIFMVQKRTFIPTNVMAFVHPLVAKSTFTCLPNTIHPTTTLGRIDVKEQVPLPTSTPTVHSHTLKYTRCLLIALLLLLLRLLEHRIFDRTLHRLQHRTDIVAPFTQTRRHARHLRIVQHAWLHPRRTQLLVHLIDDTLDQTHTAKKKIHTKQRQSPVPQATTHTPPKKNLPHRPHQHPFHIIHVHGNLCRNVGKRNRALVGGSLKHHFHDGQQRDFLFNGFQRTRRRQGSFVRNGLLVVAQQCTERG